MNWVQTHSGQAMDLADPSCEAVRLDDIALALSRANRFNGHTLGTYAYNVAHHSFLVESLLPAGTPAGLRLLVLLHDAHEAYTGDIVQPMKRHTGGSISQTEEHLDDAIHTAFGLIASDPGLPGLVRDADRLALAIEKRDLLGPEPISWGDSLPNPGEPGDPYPVLKPHEPWASYALFRNRVRMLVREAAVTPFPGVMSW